MRKIPFPKNPFLLFLPFLLFFVALAIVNPTHGNVSDENRYLMFAQNLLHGFYSPPPPDVDLGTGPGYPLVILPFLAFSLPLIFITILNAIFYYLSVVFLFKGLQQLLTFKAALIVSVCWACYYNSYENISLILTEIFASFLVCFFIYCIISAFNPAKSTKKNRYIIFSGLAFGMIVLTKVIFGYVLLLMLAAVLILWLFNRTIQHYKRALVILAIAFAVTTPYLAYTYHLSGKLFYWSTFGGDNLYWMSSPYADEYGSWIKYPISTQSKSAFFSGSEETIIAHHQKDFDAIGNVTGVEKDDALRQIAINNIKSHPVKFVENCVCNIGRMLFNYPYSYIPQKPSTLLRFPLTGIIAILMIFCFFPTVTSWRNIPFVIRFLLLFALIYLGGSVFGSAETRMFTIAVPVLLIWIAFIVPKTVSINLDISKPGNQ